MTNTMEAERAILLACWPGRDPLLRGLGIDAALVEVAGKPFIHRVVERAVALGVRRVDVLLGDDPEPYRACLGNGERWGCVIAYHYAPSNAAIPRALARQLAVIARCLLLTADAMPPEEMAPPSSYGFIESEPGLRAAWACASGAVVARALAGVGSAEALAVALRNEAQMSRADVAPTVSAGSAAALLDASRQLLDVPDYPIGIAWRPHAEGLWIGNGARIHPEARLVPPVYVGDHVLVAAGARIGPNAVVGARAIVDGGALVVDSLVLPSTYVGRGVELRRSIAAGRRLVNVDLHVEMDIRDRELLGAAAGEAASGPTLTERGLAALRWFMAWPLARLLSSPARATPRPT